MVQAKFLHTPPNSYHPFIHPNGKPFFTHGSRKNLEIFFLLVKTILPPVDCDADDWSSWSSCSDLFHQAQVAMLLTGHHGATVLQPVEKGPKRGSRTQRNAPMSTRPGRATKVLAKVNTHFKFNPLLIITIHRV